MSAFFLDQHAYFLFIVLANGNNSPRIYMSLHIILIPKQPVFALSP
jgi:hypothetical protein